MALTPHDNHPPKITATQWLLALVSLLLAGLSYLFTSNEGLAVFAPFFIVANVTLVLNTAMEAFQTRIFGKFFLVASVLFFFWLEALTLARQSPPFPSSFGPSHLFDQFSPDLVQQAYLYVAVFQLMLLTGYSIRPRMRRLMTWVTSRIDSSAKRGLVVRCLLGACAWVPLLYAYGFEVDPVVEALMASRSATASPMQNIGLWHNLYYLGMFGAAILLADSLLFRAGSRRIGLLFGGFTALPFVMLWGARHLWLFVALPACIVAITTIQGRMTPFRTLRLLAIALVVLVVIQLQLVLRQIGWGEIGGVTLAQLLETVTTGQFSALLFAEYLVPDVHGYFLEPAEPFFLIHWIPRQYWPDKPIMESWAYYNYAYTRGQAFNVTPSVIGQFHINWGFSGVLYIGLLLGVLASLADRAIISIDLKRQRAMAVVIGMFYAFLVSSFRLYSPVYFTYFIFGVVGMLLLTRRQPATQATSANATNVLRYPGLP